MSSETLDDPDVRTHTQHSGRRSDAELYEAHLRAAERVKMRMNLKAVAKDPHGKKLVRAIGHLNFVIDHFPSRSRVAVAAENAVNELLEALDKDAKDMAGEENAI